MSSITIIGIDSATKDTKIGLARGEFDGDKLVLTEVTVGTRQRSALDILVQWIDLSSQTLISIDAPLGWPVALGAMLATHQAGQAVVAPPDILFRRETDRVISQRLGKQPLEIGANLIARTAHAALKMLQDLYQATHETFETHETIPLAWTNPPEALLSAIEVYPAATLVSHMGGRRRVSELEPERVRATKIKFLNDKLVLPTDQSALLQSDHAVDAAICVVAGGDFLRGNTIAPTNLALAKQEGWIWVQQPR